MESDGLKSIGLEHFSSLRSVLLFGLLRCGVAKFTGKSTHSDVSIHFRTWVPYLTLLPTPSPTRENFLMQDFPTTLYKQILI